MKVLCAIDGSQFSQWSTDALGALASHPPKTLVLLHVLDTGRLRARGKRERVDLTRSLSAVQREGAQLLRHMAQEARRAMGQPADAPSTKIETVLAQGLAAPTIVRQAARRRADLVVLGSRGLSDISGFLLGSVSREVVAQARCPVLVIKRPLGESPRVALAMDESKPARGAAEFLRACLLGEETQLTVLSVVPPVVTDIAARVLPPDQIERLQKPAQEEGKQLLAKWRQTFLKDGCAVSTEMLTGHPSQTLIAHLERTHPDLVIVGSRGLTGTERLQLGSVSEALVKYAPCSVLVVKGRRT